MVFVVIRIVRIEAFLLFVCRGAVVVGARLLHRVLIFIQDVGDPTVFIVESEPKRINSIGKILNTSHTRTIVIRHVALKGGLPAIATPVEAADQAAAMVANHVQLVAERSRARCVPSGNDAEIIIECHGHYRPRCVRTDASPHCHVIEAQMEIESRMHLEQKEQLRAMDQRPPHIAIIERLIVAKRAVEPEYLMRKRHRHRIEGNQVTWHGPRIAAPDDMPARGRHRAQRRHPCAQKVDIHVLHARIEHYRFPPHARVQLVDHRTEIRRLLLRHPRLDRGSRVILPRQRHSPLPLELFRRIVLRPGVQQCQSPTPFRHQGELVGAGPERKLGAR